MKIIISPAKSLDFETKANTSLFTKPAFLNQSEKLNKKLKATSIKKLSDLMSISAALAELNYNRNQSWHANYDENEGKQAAYAFTGEVYRGLDINTLEAKNLPYIQENLRIVSGLYGILKPLDIMLPYRLEMGTKLKVGRTADLYQFWGNQLSQFLNDEMQSDEILVNLASTEYSKAVLTKNLK
ncbi:MAG: peroxide stress protein YaaA, partial [Polaribacter sp.]|nr:peroxide stress protein YaaA [Polaribacter sp.]